MKGLKDLWRLRHGALTNSIILLFLVFGTAPLILLFFSLQHVYNSHQKDKIGSFQMENANRVANLISQEINQHLRLVQQLGEAVQNDLFSPHLSWQLDEFLLDHPDFDQLVVLDARGREVWKTAYDFTTLVPELRDRRHEPNIQLALSGASLKLPAEAQAGVHLPRMKFLVPLKNAQGTAGVLEARMDLTSLLHKVSPPNIGKDAPAFVVGADGRLLAAHDLPWPLSDREILALPIVQAFLEGKIGVWDYTGLDGQAVIGASAIVPATGWGVVVERSRNIVAGYSNQDTLLFLGLFVLTIMAAIFSGLLFSQRRLVEPLRALQREMNSLGQGIFPSGPIIQGNDEMAQTALSFDKMARRLKKSMVPRNHMAHEVLEQKLTEETLRLREATLRSIFSTVPVGIGFLSQWKIIGGNQAFFRMVGASEEQLQDQSLGKLFLHQADYARMLEKVGQTLEEGEIADFETQWLCQDGQVRDVFLRLAIIDRSDADSDLILVAKDISDLKKMEADRLRLDKLESVGILAGGIAHDFNNILTVILGNIELVGLDLKKTDKGWEWLQEAEQACQRARHLAKQLLSLAKGGLPRQRSVAPAELLQNVVPLALSGSQATVEIAVDEDVWPIEIDADQIHQVFNSILINAHQAMPQGGLITVTARNVQVTAAHHLPLPEGRYVQFTFADQGVGINPKDLEKIFDPYFSTKQIGNGLGLTAARSIVKNHQGQIAVESEPGQGTQVHVYLPAALSASAPPVTKISTIPLRGQGRVLVMDDEASIRELLSHMLNKLGYEALCVKDGRQALEAFQRARKKHETFAAVILDLTIPGGLGGKETLELLRQLDPEINAIVSSGYGDDPMLANYQQFGFKGAIAKPYKISELGAALHQVLAEKPSRPQENKPRGISVADADGI